MSNSSVVRMVGRQVLDGGTLVTIVDGSAYNVQVDHPRYKELKEAFINKDADKFLELVNLKQVVESVTGKDGRRVQLVGNQVFYGDKELHGVVVEYIVRLVSEGFDVQPVVNFLEKLLQNPSKRSVDNLFNFLQAHKLTLAEDGDFLAYKAVRSDFKDKYSGTIDNKVGAVVTVDRNEVDDDYKHQCSHGLHVGALEYSGPNGWYYRAGDVVLIVKVSPADVVAVPEDHSFRKLRCCKYEVVSVYQDVLKKAVYSGQVGGDYSNAGYNESEDSDCEEQELVNPEDMRVDSEYVFTYEIECLNEYGDDEEVRYGLVVSNDEGSELVTMLMTGNDKSSGAYRSFHYGRMYDVLPNVSSVGRPGL